MAYNRFGRLYYYYNIILYGYIIHHESHGICTMISLRILQHYDYLRIVQYTAAENGCKKSNPQAYIIVIIVIMDTVVIVIEKRTFSSLLRHSPSVYSHHQPPIP